jgi:hypothetical protein
MENHPISPYTEPDLHNKDISNNGFGSSKKQDVPLCSFYRDYDENTLYIGLDPERTGN